MNKSEGYFVGHCDDEYCDLGSFEYTCPCCEKYNTNYEIWWEEDNIYSGINYIFNCDNCNEELNVYWDKNEIEYIIEKN